MKPRERLLQELLPMESATVPLRCIRLHLLLSVISSSSAMPSSSPFEFSAENCRKPTWHVWNFSHFCHFWQVHMSLNCRFHRLRKSRPFLVFPVTQLIVTLALPISGEFPFRESSTRQVQSTMPPPSLTCGMTEWSFATSDAKHFNQNAMRGKTKIPFTLYTQSVSINQCQSMPTKNYHQCWSISIKNHKNQHRNDKITSTINIHFNMKMNVKNWI